MKIRKFVSVIMCLLLALCFAACDNTGKPDGPADDDKAAQAAAAAQKTVNTRLSALGDEEFTYAQLMGTDSLGRKVLPTAGIDDKYVGIFYFVLLGDIGHSYIYDVQKFLTDNGTELVGNPLFELDNDESPKTQLHYWGEPLYGYYQSSDEWVVRRHMELFMNAGIDFLYLDYTNSTYEYDAGVGVLLSVVKDLIAEGYDNAPRLAFMLPHDSTDSKNKVKRVYDRWYSKSEYADCWFYADPSLNPTGAPLVVGNFTSAEGVYPNPAIDKTVAQRLWLKQMQWPSDATQADAFPWIEWKYENDGAQPNHNGYMNVSIAQHIRSWSSTSYLDAIKGGKSYSYRARGWTPDNENDHYGINADNVLAGTNFEWQWENVLEEKNDVSLVTVTGWNEWCAPKVDAYNWKVNGVEYGVFNDCFNIEFSRDAEMMKGGYGDNYYMQLARNVRRFKGMDVEGSDNVALFDRSAAASAANVSSLAAKFVDSEGDTLARTTNSVGNIINYADNSNRNNIVETRVGNDENYLYVAATCLADVTLPAENDNSWMNVYLSCPEGTNWEGFSFVIGRDIQSGVASVHKFVGNGSDVEIAGSATVSIDGKTVLYAVPLSVLGLKAGAVVGVKVTDNLRDFGNIDDFYISGDCAPLGRLNYAYKIA